MSLARVTTILREVGLAPDFSAIPPAVLEKARQRGTAVHAACQYHDEGDLDEASLDPQVAGYVTGYRRFLADSGCNVISIEEPVIHYELGYRGTLDRVAWMTGERAVIDIKATATLSPTTAIQTAAYLLAYNVTTSAPATRRYGLHLKAAGVYSLTEYSSPLDQQVWLAAVNLYRNPLFAQGREIIESWRKQHGL